MLFYIFLVASAALVPISDIFFPVLRESRSWWLVPLLFVCFFSAMVLLFIGFCALSFALIRPSGDPDRGSEFYRRLCNALIGLLVKLTRVNITVSGDDKIPENGRFLLVCNHLNDIDPAVILYALPEAQLGFIAKKEIYKTLPLISRVMHKLHCLPIDRENDRAAARTVIDAVKLLKSGKVSIGLFPEGYVSRSGELLGLRAGSLKIASRAGVPIVICTILGTPQAAGGLFIRKNSVYFDILGVIPAERVISTDTSALSEEISAVMRENLEKRKAEHPNLAGGNDSVFKRHKN